MMSKIVKSNFHLETLASLPESPKIINSKYLPIEPSNSIKLFQRMLSNSTMKNPHDSHVGVILEVVLIVQALPSHKGK